MQAASGSESAFALWEIALAVFTGLVVPLGIAVLVWRAQRKTVVGRNTFEFISNREADNPDWRGIKRRFSEIVSKPDHPKPLIALLNPKGPDEWDDRIAVAALLNHFEAVAVAIKHGTLNEVIYKDWNKSTYISTWDKAESFITETRKMTGRHKTWENFQALARKWAQEPVEKNQLT